MSSRYQQQIKLPEIGIAGQEQLQNARVLCIGAGGIGVTLLAYLAAAGVGTIGIVDDDRIDETNLHRQILYREEHLQQSKAVVAKEQLQALNSSIQVHAYELRLNRENAEQLLNDYDLVADCSDNFATRYLLHDLCFHFNKPYIYASAQQFQGYCALFYGKDNPCLHCLFPELPQRVTNCQEGGVLGTLPGLLGIIQATELLKWITNAGTSLLNRLLCIDFLTMNIKTIHLLKNSECAFCVHGQIREERYGACMTSNELPLFIDKHPNALLLDVRTRQEHEAKNIGGKLIPLAELEQRLHELDSSVPIVVYCQTGKRSFQAFNILKAAGFALVYHLVKMEL
jgi:adenylyltransferase/sulfurtransferase